MGNFRKTLTKEQRFKRMLEKHPGEDPITPILMHSLERYLKGIKDYSKVDTIAIKTLKKYPKVTNDIIKSMVNNWHAVPENIKKKFVPKEFRNLDVKKKIEPQELDKAFSRLTKKKFVPRNLSFGSRVTQSNLKKIDPRLFVFTRDVKINNITPTEPDGTPYVFLGQEMIINGEGFSSNSSENLIIIRKTQNDILQDAELGLYPYETNTRCLKVKLPNQEELAEGIYAVFVCVKNKGSSNFQMVTIHNPPAPAAYIKTITPDSQIPGSTVLIEAAEGTGFKQNPRVFWKALDPELTAGEMYGTEIEWMNDKSLLMTIPDRFVFFPGRFLLSVSGDNQGLSNWKEISIKPFSYKLEFKKMECIDASGDWWGLEGVDPDEIVTRWAISCDPNSWAKQSSEYSGFNDGTIKNYNEIDKSIFLPTGGPSEVAKELVFNTWLLEWDEGDVKAWTEVLDYATEFLEKTFKGTGLDWLKYIPMFLSKLVSWLGGDPDSLGAHTLDWTASEMRDRTDNSEHKYQDIIKFINDGDTGSYQLHYTLWRTN